MSYFGDVRLEDTFDLKFTTRQTTGAPFALASGVISAYPGNSTTQLTAGITLSADFDTVTGLNNVRVVATAANGYATATDYALVITTGTVNGVSVVGEVIGSFSIEKRSALRPTVVARTLDVSAGGEAGLDWANIGSPTTAQNLSATNIDVDQIVASVSGTVATVTTLTNLPAITANWLTAAGIAVDAGAEIADAVWDEAIAGHLGAGSTGLALNSAGSAGDPWSTAVPGAYGAGTAGSKLGRIPDIAAGGAGGLFIAGTNAATVITTSLTTTFTGNLTGSVASVTGNVTGSVGSLAAQAKADVNAEVVDALATDTYAEPSSVPAATSSLKDMIHYLFSKTRNKGTQTATTQLIRNDADSGTIATVTLSDDAVTFSKGKDT